MLIGNVDAERFHNRRESILGALGRRLRHLKLA
jgi:hypothetical protein